MTAFFREDDGPSGRLVPNDEAASNWTHAGRMVRGMAVSAAMARAAELAVDPADDLRPARWTVDLCRPVGMEPVELEATTLRRGRRLTLVQVDLLQNGAMAATARGLFLKVGEPTSGERWHSDHPLHLPPALPTPDEPRRYFSEPAGWTTTAASHHNSAPKHVWQLTQAIVEDEEPSAFQVASACADLASMTTHWGTTGLTFVNADMSLSLARLPVGREIGVVGHDRWESDGIAIGTALLQDREGVFGSSTVSGLGNARNVVDPGARDR
jgi:hypothetical protein